MKKNFIYLTLSIGIIMAYITFFDTYLNYIQVIVSDKYFDNYLKENNNEDIIGRIAIDKLNIKSLIVQADNNNYYLNHDENKQSNKSGAIFLDYRNNIELDRKILIYGHNSQIVNTAFNNLEKYLNKENINSKITIETKNKIMYYQVFSVIIIPTNSEHLKLQFNKDSWKSHVEWLNNETLYNTNLKANKEDSILVLQTCYYGKNGDYLLIAAKKIKEEKKENSKFL